MGRLDAQPVVRRSEGRLGIRFIWERSFPECGSIQGQQVPRASGLFFASMARRQKAALLNWLPSHGATLMAL
jgi:hypothetical protein